MNAEKTKINMVIDVNEKKRLEDIASQNGLTLSAFIRLVLGRTKSLDLK